MRKTQNITAEYLTKHPDHIFVFGDNILRVGYGGAAALRDFENTYGFITKKYPSHNDDAYFNQKEYADVFKTEIGNLILAIKNNPNKTYLISKLGSGLANKYMIWENIIQPGLEVLRKYKNVIFLY